MPIHFRTDTYIEGISATDIFTLNSALGATIEEQVVATLNQMRSVWDPDGAYVLYRFVRQPQTFPDVILCRSITPPKDELLGIELKGWYLLSKEAEPSFRYAVTPQACADADLLVCVPWSLQNILSGHPTVFAPYIKPARYAAELRNHYWQHARGTEGDTKIAAPTGPIAPYPNKSQQISDTPARDGGGNFGRIARTKIMDAYLAQTLQQPLCGVPAKAWLEFFKLFTESIDSAEVLRKISTLRRRWAAAETKEPCPAKTYLAILDAIEKSL